MVILMCFIVAELLILLLVSPIIFTIKINFSLAREKGIVAIKIFGITPVVLKIEKQKELFRISINGKIIGKTAEKNGRAKKKKKSSVNWLDLMKSLLGFVEKIDCLGMVGGQDAFYTSLSYLMTTNFLALFDEKLDRFLIVPNFENDVFILDMAIKCRISILYIFEMVGIYGNKRNFKTHNRQFKRGHQH